MTTYYIWLSIFSVIAYFVATDESVAKYVILMYKLLGVNVKRFYWILRFHPKNPITNLIKRWEYDKIARQLRKEFKD